jgi:hypothetical protein
MRFDALGADQKALGLLDFLEHLEDALRRTGKETLVGLAQATTLEGIAAGSVSFGHSGSPYAVANLWSGLRGFGTGGCVILAESLSDE